MTKGAPDVLLARCTHERVGEGERVLTTGRRAEIQAAVDRLAGEALRTLGLASRELPAGAATPSRAEDERDLVWLGVVGMIDPPRPEAADAVRTAHAAGVRVVMITGDHPATASAIAAELGIAPRGERAVLGADLARMSDAELAATAARAHGLRARQPRAQARDRARPPGRRAGRRDDRRRRERRAGAQGRRHRHRDGHHRHRRREGGGRHGAHRRQLRLDRRRDRGGARRSTPTSRSSCATCSRRTSARCW